MANTAAQFVVDTYQQDLGGPPKPENLIYWASKIQSGEMTEAEVKAAIQGSAEGIAYAQNQTPSQERAEYAASLEQGDGTVNTAVQATEADIRSAYTELLGGPPKPEALEYWLSQGLTPAKLKESIAASPEGQQYATTQKVSPERQAYMDSLAAGNDGGQPPNTANFNPLIQQYYQELFNRQAQQPGLDYFSGRLSSGDLTEDALRDAIIAGAQGTDRMYYDASQSGGPVFDATQALFGRRPARGAFNPETGQLEGGFGQYRSQLDAGNLTPEQLRGRLVQLAYNRGEGGGQSGDYQNYLNTLGIDRSGNPFLQDGGTYANVRYGSDLSQYQPNPGMPPPPPGRRYDIPAGRRYDIPAGRRFSIPTGRRRDATYVARKGRQDSRPIHHRQSALLWTAVWHDPADGYDEFHATHDATNDISASADVSTIYA